MTIRQKIDLLADEVSFARGKKENCKKCGGNSLLGNETMIVCGVKIDVPIWCECETNFEAAMKAAEKYDNRVKTVIERIPKKYQAFCFRAEFQNEIEPFSDFQNVIFLGNLGSGKTALLYCYSAILQIEFQRRVKYSTYSELLNEIDSRDEARRGIIETYQKADVLIIDDFANDKVGAEWILRGLTEIIDYRYRNEKKTFFATNMHGKKSIAENTTVQIADRVFEAGISTQKAVTTEKSRRVR